jgi:hypothetical protein
LYKLLYSSIVVNESAQVAKENENLTIWNERFGHLSKQNLKLLLQKNIVVGMNAKTNHQLDFCKGCVVGKQCRNPFQKGNPQKNHQSPFELVHIDLCGSMKTTSVGGAKYFMTFRDNTIMLWTYFLKKN